MSDDRREPVRSLLLSVLVVTAVFAGSVPLGAGAQQTVTGTERATATFNRSTVSEERGDIAAVELRLSDTRNATVTVGSEGVNYRTNVTVEDGNDDGSITVLMNTFVAGMEGTDDGVYGVANDDDAVTRTNRTTGRLDAPLDTSRYNLSVAVDGRETDTATLALTERTTDELVTWTAPAASFDNVTSASEVARAVDDGRITTTDSVAVGDVLVLQFKLSGIYGALEASNFTRLVEEGALDLTIEQTNPGTNRRPKRLDLDRSLANGSIRVVPDERNDVLYVNVNTTAATFENGAPVAGDELESTLTLDGGSRLTRSDRSISANVTAVDTELSLGEVGLTADRNQTVTGTTSVAPGSEVTVRIQNNESGSFLQINTTAVKSNGTFDAEFNLSSAVPRSTVIVRADGPLNTSDRATATVRRNRSSGPTNGTASLVVADQRTSGETVRIENATLPAGGFVVVRAPDGTTTPAGRVLGASSYLSGGTTGDVEVTLDEPVRESTRVVAVAHTDSNANQVYDFISSNGSEDGPYTADGSPVTATARLALREVTRRTTTEGGTTERTAGGTDATDGATETTGGNGPGFGFGLAVVVLAGLVVAALAARRE